MEEQNCTCGKAHKGKRKKTTYREAGDPPSSDDPEQVQRGAQSTGQGPGESRRVQRLQQRCWV